MTLLATARCVDGTNQKTNTRQHEARTPKCSIVWTRLNKKKIKPKRVGQEIVASNERIDLENFPLTNGNAAEKKANHREWESGIALEFFDVLEQQRREICA